MQQGVRSWLRVVPAILAHCAKAIAEAGYLPICYDNLSTGHASFVQWGPFIVGDVHDSQKISSIIREHNVQAVLHFVAFSAVGDSVGNPDNGEL